MNQQEIQPHPSTQVQNPETLSHSPFTYEYFANQPEIIKNDKELIGRAFSLTPEKEANKKRYHLDIATGTGHVLRLIIPEYQERGYRGKIIGIDPNAMSLAIARRDTIAPDGIDVEYIEGYGQDLQRLVAGKIPEEGVDSVSIHNALHEIPGEDTKRKVLKGAVSVLRPGGLFTFNSAFVTESQTLDYGKWKAAVLRLVGTGRDKKIETIKYHSSQEYEEMITNTGLQIVHRDIKSVNLSRESLEAISIYPEFREGFFRDIIGQEEIPPEKKSEFAIKALDVLKVEKGFPRKYHEIIAQKPLTPAFSTRG